jgi:hypothetical protein
VTGVMVVPPKPVAGVPGEAFAENDAVVDDGGCGGPELRQHAGRVWGVGRGAICAGGEDIGGPAGDASRAAEGFDVDAIRAGDRFIDGQAGQLRRDVAGRAIQDQCVGAIVADRRGAELDGGQGRGLGDQDHGEPVGLIRGAGADRQAGERGAGALSEHRLGREGQRDGACGGDGSGLVQRGDGTELRRRVVGGARHISRIRNRKLIERLGQLDRGDSQRGFLRDRQFLARERLQRIEIRGIRAVLDFDLDAVDAGILNQAGDGVDRGICTGLLCGFTDRGAAGKYRAEILIGDDVGNARQALLCSVGIESLVPVLEERMVGSYGAGGVRGAGLFPFPENGIGQGGMDDLDILQLARGHGGDVQGGPVRELLIVLDVSDGEPRGECGIEPLVGLGGAEVAFPAEEGLDLDGDPVGSAVGGDSVQCRDVLLPRGEGEVSGGHLLVAASAQGALLDG